jgi:hypothetical protein
MNTIDTVRPVYIRPWKNPDTGQTQWVVYPAEGGLYLHAATTKQTAITYAKKHGWAVLR